MRSCKLWLVFSSALAIASQCFSGNALAVVNVDRTRIIFSANQTSQTLNVKNGPENPTVVQIWSDEGDLMQSPDLSKTPVFAMPPMMRLSPDEQRSIRLVLTTRQSLPEDRESLYWLNIYQIPALTQQTGSAERKIVLPLRIRLKVFVRPATLNAPKPDDAQKLRFVVKGNQLRVENPTRWFMSLRLQIANKIQVNDVMVAPLTTQSITLSQPAQPNEKVSYEVFDDNGNPVSYISTTRSS
ncbi:fimbrial assembly chaperone [Pantoea rwandensis]|uniref:Fimbrial assembly protein n=1 Tax=Pantoea rwandensis TaxID=1076550 RepID=A0A1X1CSK4_9GAMM|nr:fimbrial assembly chaperone [Pantoea rwandensis]ORM67321.1 fimbrial assembly protein [Pantoea rwandensis]